MRLRTAPERCFGVLLLCVALFLLRRLLPCIASVCCSAPAAPVASVRCFRALLPRVALLLLRPLLPCVASL
eukprot:2166503-Alexandrium_andersonii.AAC.1